MHWRTDRNLRQRKAELIPKWLVQTMTQRGSVCQHSNGNLMSSIAKHLITTGDVVDPVTSFVVLLCNRISKLLASSEALLIRRHELAFFDKRC
ncbi:hypothetical protein PHET_12465 [Paragonimus heterotremus]|uniref:Uncharacterized protein n=1 Tax=Paragonimus heterotremus TaxID=100268 RepID=A0A8J4SZZ5_9TREM|nr:hypothetical protein PHET_12465 [Paragonimus heterotremus]